MSASDDLIGGLPSEEWGELHRIAKAFEAAWQSGACPALADYLPPGRADVPLLLELARLDLEHRLRRGETARVEAYLERFPELARSPTAVLELASAEHEHRRHWEAGLTPEAYLERFPAHRDALLGRLGEGAPADTWNDLARPHSPSGHGLPAVAGHEVLEELGRGGMGVVYKARQSRLDRLVALKMILAGGHAGEDERQRFRTEAEAIARLQHPNIVQVFEVGEHEGKPFFSLEFCPGGSLEKKLGAAPLPPAEAARMVEALARAMHAAHVAHVVHRDLKPANVLLAADGTPKITDFGLARKLDEAGQTRPGAVMGTPSYMAPEQAAGRGKEVGPLADVYALGAILYECLTGRPPFKAATALETMAQVVSDEPVSPRQLQPGCPRDLETVCLKCLEKEPDKRYDSAAELADDLGRFRKGEVVHARPVGRAERAWRWCKRYPARAGLLAASVVALVALVGGGVALGYSGKLRMALGTAEEERGRAEAQRAEADRQRGLAQDNAAEAVRQRELGRRYLYAAQMNLAQQAWHDAEVPTARALLDGLRKQGAALEPLKGLEWGYLNGLVAGGGASADAVAFAESSGRITGVAFTPDGSSVLTANCMDAIRLRDARTGSVRATLHGGGAFKALRRDETCAVAVSRDGRYAFATSVVADEHWLRVWALRVNGADLVRAERIGAPKRIHPGRPTASVAISHDAVRLAWADLDGRVGLLDTGRNFTAPFAKRAHYLEAHAGAVHAVAFHPQTGRLLSAGSDGALRLWAWPKDGAPRKKCERELKGHTGPVWGVAFSADGLWAASAGEDRSVRLWSIAGGWSGRVLARHDAPVHAIAFSRDGRRLASAGADRTVKVWDLGTGEAMATLRGHSASVNAVAFAPDGLRLISGADDREARIWDLRELSGAQRLQGRGRLGALAFAPDGRLAAAGPVQPLMLWGRDGKVVKLSLPALAHGPGALAFSRDGNRLAAAGATVGLWNARTGRAIHAFPGHGELARAVAFSPDDKWLASAGDDGVVKVWDVASKAEKHALRGHDGNVYAVAFSPGGELLASAGQDRTVRLWDVASGREVRRLAGHTDGVTAVAFVSEKVLATSSQDQTVRLWSVKTGEEEHVLRGHTGWVLDVAASPDGRRIASASHDGQVKLWDAVTGQVVFAFRSRRGAFRCVRFRAPDGKALAAAGDEGAVYVWQGRRN